MFTRREFELGQERAFRLTDLHRQELQKEERKALVVEKVSFFLGCLGSLGCHSFDFTNAGMAFGA
jgi:hypothetical protein